MTDDKHFEIAKLGYRQAIIVALIGAVPAVMGTLAATGYFSEKQEPKADTTFKDEYPDLRDAYADLERDISGLQGEKAVLERAVVELRATNDRLEGQIAALRNVSGGLDRDSETQIRDLQKALDDSRDDVSRLELQKTGYVERIETLESEKAQLRRNLTTSKRYPNVDGTWKNAKGAIRTIDQYGMTGECLMITEENLRYRGWFDDEVTVRANPPTGERFVAKLTKAGTEIDWTHGKPWKR